MKKFLFATVLLSSINFASYAQMQGAYDIAVGVRIGYLSGITVKHFLDESAAIEGLVTTTGFRNTTGFTGYFATGLFQLHKYIQPPKSLVIGRPDLHWIFGVGSHLGYFDGADYYRNFRDFGTNVKQISTGIDLQIGIEARFKVVPIAVAFDFKPFYDINFLGPSFNDYFLDGSISLRYVFDNL